MLWYFTFARTGHHRMLCYGGHDAVERTANAHATNQNAEKGARPLGQSDQGDRHFKKTRETQINKHLCNHFLTYKKRFRFIPHLTCMGKLQTFLSRVEIFFNRAYISHSLMCFCILRNKYCITVQQTPAILFCFASLAIICTEIICCFMASRLYL